MTENDLHMQLMRITGRLEGRFDEILSRFDHIDDKLTKHDSKLEGLKTFQDNLTGRTSVIAAVAAFFFAFIGSWIQAHFFHVK